MRVLFIIDSLKSGGKERRLVSLIESFTTFNDIEMELIVLSEKIHYKEILDSGIKIHYLKKDLRKDLRIILKFRAILNSFKPDIMHCWDNIAAMHFAPLCWIKRIPFINSMVTAAPPLLNVFSKKLITNALSYPFSTVILSNSKAGLISFRVPKSKGCCIHNGFDFKRIKIKTSKKDIRQKFDINTKNVVGMTASFSDRKDYETFVKAGEIILKKNKDVTFVAVGGGDNLETIKNSIHQGNLKYFKFVGVQSDVESIVNIFDIGVLATYAEGISNAIMEYMAFEKPVIATDGGGTKELIAEDETGFLIKKKDYIGLSEKIEFLLSNPMYAKNMGVNGKKRIEEFFSIDRMVDETYKLYLNNLKN